MAELEQVIKDIWKSGWHVLMERGGEGQMNFMCANDDDSFSLGTVDEPYEALCMVRNAIEDRMNKPV